MPNWLKIPGLNNGHNHNANSKRTPFPLPVAPPLCQNNQSESQQQNEFSKELLNNFWNFSADKASQMLEEKDPAYWEKRGEQLALSLFHAAAERVPAYKDFLKKKQRQAQAGQNHK